MSQTEWNRVKQSKGFYVKVYRQIGTFLLLSAVINLSLSAVLYYIYFNRPEPDYYATDGVRPPLNLVEMNEPNNSSVPILKSDPVDDQPVNVMPQ